MSRFAALVRKEFTHMRRDPRTLFVALFMPILQLLLLGYAANIVPFYQANCAVCHSVAAGIGRPSLDTYEDWSTNVARIIAAVQEGRMPNNGRQLTGGTVDLIKKWRDGGLRR